MKNEFDSEIRETSNIQPEGFRSIKPGDNLSVKDALDFWNEKSSTNESKGEKDYSKNDKDISSEDYQQGKTSSFETSESNDQNNEVIDTNIDIGTPEGIRDLIDRHPEQADSWNDTLDNIHDMIEVVNDPQATPLEKNSASNKIKSLTNGLKGQMFETAVKEKFSDKGFDVEAFQRVVEGESGKTKPDVIAHNNTDYAIEAFGNKIEQGETISAECKCGKAIYLKDQLEKHIPNQLSGLEGKKVLLATSDINKVDSGLVQEVCGKYDAQLVVANVSASDVDSAIKEVALK